MTPRFVVRPAANVDVAEAAVWYETRGTGLGSEFVRAVDACFAQIQRGPERFPVIYKTARKALIRRFPYVIYFVETPGHIQIIACMHSKKDPRRWQARV